jgi:hypothetical protein
VTAWQRRRTALSHDWLKNRYLPALASWANILDGRIQDPVFETSFETEVLAQWETRRVEALALINSFSSEMSPRQLVIEASTMANDADLRPILAEFIHELWMFRNRVAKLVWIATARLRTADTVYLRMKGKLNDKAQVDRFTVWKDIRPDFDAFARHCRRLGRILTRFEDDISIV